MKAAQLVLVRHGQSVWNKENRFTGWVDVDLSPKGEEEAQRAGTLLHAEITAGRLNVMKQVFTSDLKRAQKTLDIILSILKITPIIHRSQKLNERHYGELQGKNKEETAKAFGAEQVHIWRRSFDIAPPGGESLKDTAARTLPYFYDAVVPTLKDGETVLISAHGNSLRSIVMDLEKLTPEQIVKRELETGVPIHYSISVSSDKKITVLSKRELH